MLFRFGAVHRALGWLLTVLGVVTLAIGGRGYVTGAPIRPGWAFGGLAAIVVGSGLVRWARRTRAE